MRRNNIVLVGFMGTGKTTAGRVLAAELGWRFIDMDAYIEETEGASIAVLFTERGEAYFRKAETDALRTLMLGERKIISTGGGAVLAEENRKLMRENGLVVALRASRETIIARVNGDRNRPLLQGNLEDRVDRLLAERRNAYDFAELFVDTDALDPAEIAAHILQAGGMKNGNARR